MINKSRSEEIKNSKDDFITGMDEAKRKNLEEEEKKLEDDKSHNELQGNEEDKEIEQKEPKEVPEIENEVDSEEFIKQMGTEAYIDFSEFAKLIAIFNPRFNLDEKVKFYFRMFDFNHDKRITEDDLSKVIDTIFEGKEVGLEEDDKKVLVEKIMIEADNGQKEYLDYDDLEKVLWATNIEQKCSMTFFMS